MNHSQNVKDIVRTKNEKLIRSCERAAGVGRQLVYSIKWRKTSYLGHILRGRKYSVVRLMLQGKIGGWRGIDRRSILCCQDIDKWTGSSNSEHRYALSVAI